MTANLIIRTPEGFLLVTDSRLLSAQRSPGGIPQILSDHAQKLFRLSSHTACACSGYAGSGNELPDFFQKHAPLFEDFSPKQCAIAVWERAFEIFPALPDNASTSLVIAGYADRTPQLFRILVQSTSVSLEAPRAPAFTWFAFGDETFTGIVRESRLLDGVPNLDTALEYARYLVQLSQDLLSRRLPVSPIGGAVQVAVITPDQPFRMMT